MRRGCREAHGGGRRRSDARPAAGEALRELAKNDIFLRNFDKDDVALLNRAADLLDGSIPTKQDGG
jgi:hypothetical protein